MKQDKYLGNVRRTVSLGSDIPMVIFKSKITAEQSTLNFIVTACWRAAKYCRENDDTTLADNYQALGEAIYYALEQHGYYD